MVQQADDLDEGTNADITYTLLNYTENFNISANGTVYVIKALDAETSLRTIQITVMATDGGTPALSSTAVLRLELIDLNDNTPRFTETLPLITVSEITELGMMI